jgi:iron complex transport system ATP-binding protein
MMRAENVSVHRDGKCVLVDIDVTLNPGEMLGVLGPNGAGKSTLLGALCGELKTSQGQLWLDDQPLAHWSGQQRAQRLAVLPQSSTLSFAFKVQEVVAMGRLPHDSGQHRDTEIIQASLEAADALHLSDRSYLALSGGERQRVHLARVLAQLWPGEGGQTLLLDEPTSMLDPLHQHTTLQAVREFANRGGAVMVILHDLNLAARYCDRILLLESGRSHAIGAPDAVLVPDALRAVFGLEVLVQRHPERGHPLIIAR